MKERKSRKTLQSFLLMKIKTKYKFNLILLSIFIILAFLLGIYLEKNNIFRRIKPLFYNTSTSVSNYLEGLKANPQIIFIDISPENYQKLAKKRDQALSRGILVSGGDDYVPATITYKGEIKKIKIRLKGDMLDHLRTDKWSFRIKISGKNTLFGMKRFSLHHPQTRRFIYEWIYHQALKYQNIISLRYEFIKVIVNGKDLGIYALEEHFDKILLENNKRREGPIIRFNEDLMWEEQNLIVTKFPNQGNSGYGSYMSSDISTFKTKSVISDSVKFNLFKKASCQLELFRRGELKTSDIFDIHKLAMFFAIADLMGAEHSARWHNARFYYNPLTSLLEPIGFDADCGVTSNSLSISFYEGNKDYHSGKYYETLFKDELFFREYIKALEKVADKSYYEKLLEKIDEELSANLQIIYSEFPLYEFDKYNNIVTSNQKYLTSMLNPVKCFHAYFHSAKENVFYTELGNIQVFPVEILNISYKDSILLGCKDNILLNPIKKPKPVYFQIAGFIIPENLSFSDTLIRDLKINYRILGTNKIRQESIFPWPHIDNNFIAKDIIRDTSNIEEFDFLEVNDTSKRIIIKSGNWNINKNLIIPEGYVVHANESLNINLLDNAVIISYSPLSFIGTEENPIQIFSSDSTGQGIVVLNAKGSSVLKYVNFSSLSNFCERGSGITGAVTFYSSDVSIFNCTFSDNHRGDDYLNIISSDFSINNAVFSNTYADALDCDFCKGTIKDTRFFKCGGDALDISGTILEMNNIIINYVGDKGLTVGENSKLKVKNISITNAELAVTCKDLSEIILSDIKITNSSVAYCAFQKKPEFGPARIVVINSEISETAFPYIIELESKLFIDNIEIESNRINVKEILSGKKYEENRK